MNDFFMIHMYLSKKNIKLVTYKKTSIGFYLAEEPWRILSNDYFDQIIGYIKEMFGEIEKQPISSNVKSNFLKQTLGVKNFKQFSKTHLCIIVKYYVKNDEIVVNNECRLSDGSYGQTKGITDDYCTVYKCEYDQNDKILENIKCAIEDGKRFLER